MLQESLIPQFALYPWHLESNPASIRHLNLRSGHIYKQYPGFARNGYKKDSLAYDILGRQIAKALTQRLNQPVEVINQETLEIKLVPRLHMQNLMAIHFY